MTRLVRELRAIAALGEHLHYGRGAAAAGMAQPHLSTLVRRVEAELGFPLFERRPRVRATEAGEIFCAGARRAVATFDAAAARARRAASGEAGGVRTGFASSAMLTGIPSFLRAFRDVRPEVELRLVEMHSGEQAEALRSGALDVGINREERLGEEFEGTPLLSEPFVVLVPASHPLARLSSTETSRLAGEPLVLFRREAAPQMHDQITALTGGRAPAHEEAREWHTVLAFVRSGFGVTVAPRSVGALATPDLALVAISDPHPPTTLTAWRVRDGRNPAAAALVAHLKGSAQVQPGSVG